MKKNKKNTIKYSKEKILLRDYLIGIKGRLQGETGVFMEVIKKHAFLKNYIGFWSGIRLLMPIIETLAKAYYPNTKNPSIKFLKEKLHYEAPNLIWKMFRHTLIHSDVPSTARYGNKTVDWRISINSHNHYIANGVLNIDILKLYNDIEDFLISEINKNPIKVVKREYEIKVINPTKELIEEFELSTRSN